jgi:hypothetical protein
MNRHCPACGAETMMTFYTAENIPVHSVRLLHSREEAVNFPTGKMDLSHCSVCGFICNHSFDPNLQDYSAEYESTQAYSPTFNSFSRKLANQLIERYDLHKKEIIEIGCGQGEFLSLLCELGQNSGVGFDPAYNPNRPGVSASEMVSVIPDYYSEKYSGHKADFILCKMTLEHIKDVGSFVETVRRSIGSQPDTTVFFQVPDVLRILKEAAFWDIYYEHCSYFSLGSLARLFRQHNFEVRDLWRDYGDQYLMIGVLPVDSPTNPSLTEEDDLEDISSRVASFTKRAPEQITWWNSKIKEAVHQGQKVVLWGSGSKGVAFLTTLGLCDEIEYTVDINPNKENTFMAGTGQRVVSPNYLNHYKPDLVILMNPVYQPEVQSDLNARGLFPQIVSVGF